MAEIGYSPLPPNLSQELVNSIGRMTGKPAETLTKDNCANPRFGGTLGVGAAAPEDPLAGKPPDALANGGTVASTGGPGSRAATGGTTGGSTTGGTTGGTTAGGTLGSAANGASSSGANVAAAAGRAGSTAAVGGGSTETRAAAAVAYNRPLPTSNSTPVLLLLLVLVVPLVLIGGGTDRVRRIAKGEVGLPVPVLGDENFAPQSPVRAPSLPTSSMWPCENSAGDPCGWPESLLVLCSHRKESQREVNLGASCAPRRRRGRCRRYVPVVDGAARARGGAPDRNQRGHRNWLGHDPELHERLSERQDDVERRHCRLSVHRADLQRPRLPDGLRLPGRRGRQLPGRSQRGRLHRHDQLGADRDRRRAAPRGERFRRRPHPAEEPRSVGSPAQTVACVDIARSSSKGDNSPTGPENGFEYYGFALDAVSWATPASRRRATLTRPQVKDIWTCAPSPTGATWAACPARSSGTCPNPGPAPARRFLSEFLDITNNASPPRPRLVPGGEGDRQVRQPVRGEPGPHDRRCRHRQGDPPVLGWRVGLPEEQLARTRPSTSGTTPASAV